MKPVSHRIRYNMKQQKIIFGKVKVISGVAKNHPLRGHVLTDNE